MPSIEYAKQVETQEHEIKAGTIFSIRGGVEHLILCANLEDGFSLMDVSNMEIVTPDINHPVHAMNYVQKHYGDFELIYEDEYSIVINK